MTVSPRSFIFVTVLMSLVFNVTVGLVYPFQLGFSLEKDKVKWLEIMFHDKGCKLYTSANVAPANNLKPTTALWRSSKRQTRYISA